MNNDKNIYVIDLDGTLCNTPDSGGHDNDYNCNYLEATPIKKRIKQVNQLHDQGHIIIVESSRGVVSGKNWFYDTLKQLRCWGLKFDVLRTGKKFMADVYVDDKAISANNFFEGEDSSDMLTSLIEKESGSGTQTKIVLVNRVLKEATDERMDKLIDEINFLEKLPRKFIHHFPQVVKSDKSKKDKVFYEMTHFNLPTIRRLILSEVFKTDELIYWTDKITKFSLEMYRHEIIDTPDYYLDYMHYNRLKRRLEELQRKSNIFSNILELKEIEINGETYDNIPVLAQKLDSQKIRKSVMPEFVGRWSHSDLHYSNILVDIDNDNFILIDPRGYDFCDYYYDFGKLWHSVNGKYEMISSGLFELKIDNSHSYYFELSNKAIVQTLNNTKKQLPELLQRYSNDSKDDMIRKTEFNECVHFASLVPFLLDFDGKEERAIVAYLTASQLINNYFNKYIK